MLYVRIIALANQKGGVGKTTSTINIGTGLTQFGRTVLLADLDPQAHLTYSLGIPAHELEATIYEVLRGQTTLDKVMLQKYGVTILPASLDLSGAEIELAAVPGREFLLREAMSTLQEFDYVLLDCPPSLGLLTLNALTTATEVYIPLQTEFLALQGLSKLLQTVDIVKKRLNPTLSVTGIIGTRYDHRKKLSKEVVEKIQGYFGAILFPTLIRDNIALAEAPSFGQDIFTYRPLSHGAEDYRQLCQEIIKRGRIDGERDAAGDGSVAVDPG
jgi:chromosome partitioning protein